jgi:hypothetical protein
MGKMDLVRLIGKGCYYLGLFIMVMSVIMLIASVAADLTQVMGRVAQATSDPVTAAPCAGGPCVQTDNTPAYDNLFDMALYPSESLLGDYVDEYFRGIGLNQLQTDKSVPGAMYGHIRRFFLHMLAGLVVLMLGILILLLGGFVGFFAPHNKKNEILVQERLGVMARKEKR